MDVPCFLENVMQREPHRTVSFFLEVPVGLISFDYVVQCMHTHMASNAQRMAYGSVCMMKMKNPRTQGVEGQLTKAKKVDLSATLNEPRVSSRVEPRNKLKVSATIMTRMNTKRLFASAVDPCFALCNLKFM